MATSKQLPVLAGKIVEHQGYFNVLSTQDMQSAILNPEGFIKYACDAWVKKLAKDERLKIKGFLNLISGAEMLTIDACDGSCISGSTEIFDGWIDSDFENCGFKITGPSTRLTNLQVCEIVEDGTFEKIYVSQGRELDSMCLSQGQIKKFIKKYRNWLRTDGYGTFFLFKANNQFFVARVRFDSSRLGVGVGPLLDDYVWYADDRHRFVIPQPTLGN